MKELCEDDYKKILRYIAKCVSKNFEKHSLEMTCVYVDDGSVHMMWSCSKDKPYEQVKADCMSYLRSSEHEISSASEYFKLMQARVPSLTALREFFMTPPESLLVQADLDVES